MSLANCYFTRDSSGFPALLRFFDAQSGRSFHPILSLYSFEKGRSFGLFMALSS